MIYIETGSSDVYYNFALEYYFTVEKRLPDTVFLFWRTTPTLMVGKYQNVLEEINKPYADSHGIRLVRRMSGGNVQISAAGSLPLSSMLPKSPSSFVSTSLPSLMHWGRWGCRRPLTDAMT